MKEAYQQAVMQSESSANIHKSEKIESCDTKSLKERFEKGELQNEREQQKTEDEENEVYQSGMYISYYLYIPTYIFITFEISKT